MEGYSRLGKRGKKKKAPPRGMVEMHNITVAPGKDSGRYITVRDYYCLSFPGAGMFIRVAQCRSQSGLVVVVS